MRLHSNRVRPEPWGCGGLVPLDTPAEQPLPLNSAGFDHKIVRENGFARNRQPAAPPRRRDERVPATACPLFPSLAAGTAGHSNRVALFSCQGFLAWGLSALCALFPPGEPELLPAPSPSSPTRIPLRITPPYPAPSIPPSPYSCTQRTEKPAARLLIALGLTPLIPSFKYFAEVPLTETDQ